MAKNYKGGLQLVDLENNTFTSGEATTITGVHNTLVNQNKKRTIFQNFAIGEVKYPDIDIPLSLDSDGTFTGSVVYGNSTITVTVTNADAITFTVTENA